MFYLTILALGALVILLRPNLLIPTILVTGITLMFPIEVLTLVFLAAIAWLAFQLWKKSRKCR